MPGLCRHPEPHLTHPRNGAAQELLDADDPDAPNIAGQTVTARRTIYADTIPL
ncbi:MAG TPA: hypothetical protein VFR40_08075 [Lapillicoccus sp.]|nr:hypothetical protein [Lapillicoccus sp.]